LAADDLAGYVITIVETGGPLKCRLALDSIALGYAESVLKAVLFSLAPFFTGRGSG
jgi:hypothetical protein